MKNVIGYLLVLVFSPLIFSGFVLTLLLAFFLAGKGFAGGLLSWLNKEK